MRPLCAAPCIGMETGGERRTADVDVIVETILARDIFGDPDGPMLGYGPIDRALGLAVCVVAESLLKESRKMRSKLGLAELTNIALPVEFCPTSVPLWAAQNFDLADGS